MSTSYAPIEIKRGPGRTLDTWDAFTQHVALQPTERGCLLWKGLTRGRSNPYGFVTQAGRRIQAHRFAWELMHGKVPDGLVVRHRCDTPLCVNVEHLELGTHRENTADIGIRKRWGDRRGQGNGAAKLTEDEVREMIRMRRDGAKLRTIAERFGIGVPNVSEITRGRIWSHIYAEEML